MSVRIKSVLGTYTCPRHFGEGAQCAARIHPVACVDAARHATYRSVCVTSPHQRVLVSPPSYIAASYHLVLYMQKAGVAEHAGGARHVSKDNAARSRFRTPHGAPHGLDQLRDLSEISKFQVAPTSLS